MIADYLDTLSRALSFDPRLARSVRREVEDHLCEAVAASPLSDRGEAERRAVARFGRADALAADFALSALARGTRRLGLAVLLAIAAVLATMKGRVVWYAAMDWRLDEVSRALAKPVLLVDRCGFWLAVAVAVVTFAYLRWHRLRLGGAPIDPRVLRRAGWLCAGATVALIVAVLADAVLTALQVGADLRLSAVIPIGSMAIEIACVAALAGTIRATARRVSAAEALLAR
ncbi:MAG: hypothetical protein JO021_05825 [Alphaproteobacteria bacterium]|nr:hypothetical protein [Alphaproteobacteria bacterium]